MKYVLWLEIVPEEVRIHCEFIVIFTLHKNHIWWLIGTEISSPNGYIVKPYNSEVIWGKGWTLCLKICYIQWLVSFIITSSIVVLWLLPYECTLKATCSTECLTSGAQIVFEVVKCVVATFAVFSVLQYLAKLHNLPHTEQIW